MAGVFEMEERRNPEVDATGAHSAAKLSPPLDYEPAPDGASGKPSMALRAGCAFVWVVNSASVVFALVWGIGSVNSEMHGGIGIAGIFWLAATGIFLFLQLLLSLAPTMAVMPLLRKKGWSRILMLLLCLLGIAINIAQVAIVFAYDLLVPHSHGAPGGF
jgi:hypothetical protein